MSRQKPFCLTFAGPVGSSKTPIATYLSWNLGLPIFNNDAIRSEIAEDLDACPPDVLATRRNERLKALLASGRPFIGDFSVDRDWERVKTMLVEAGYDVFLISLDLSRDRLERMYLAKGYHESLHALDRLMADHAAFIHTYGSVIGFSVTEATFGERLEGCLRAVRAWMSARGGAEVF